MFLPGGSVGREPGPDNGPSGDSLFDTLACGARVAVSGAWRYAAAATGGPPDEIDHIYAMTTKGIQELGAQWSPILHTHRIALRITGVFCHQTPKAHYFHPTDGPKSPKLGDLLVVHEHKISLRGGGAPTPCGAPCLFKPRWSIRACHAAVRSTGIRNTSTRVDPILS